MGLLDPRPPSRNSSYAFLCPIFNRLKKVGAADVALPACYTFISSSYVLTSEVLYDRNNRTMFIVRAFLVQTNLAQISNERLDCKWLGLHLAANSILTTF